MIKNNLKIKDNITFVDKTNAITNILEWIFENETYEPWFKEPARIYAVCTNFLEGIEFEENDPFLDIYEEDEELKELVDLFISPDEDFPNYYAKIMEFVDDNVERAEEYTCNLMVHSVQNYDLTRIVEACNVIIDSLENYSKLNINRLSEEQLGNVVGFFDKLKDSNLTQENISDAIKDSVGINWDKNAEEVIDAKNEKIRELEEKLNTEQLNVEKLDVEK